MSLRHGVVLRELDPKALTLETKLQELGSVINASPREANGALREQTSELATLRQSAQAEYCLSLQWEVVGLLPWRSVAPG